MLVWLSMQHGIRSILTSFLMKCTSTAAWCVIFMTVGGGTAFAVQFLGLKSAMLLGQTLFDEGVAVITSGVLMCSLWPVLGICTRKSQKAANALGISLSWDAACKASWLGYMVLTPVIGHLMVNKTIAYGLAFFGIWFVFWWRKPRDI